MRSSVIFALILAFANPVRAVIWDHQEVVASFTNPAVVITNFTWSDGISVSSNGVGWDGGTNAHKDFWIQSNPIAIGTSWRPATVVGITTETDPQNAGFLFARYSVDKQHWSTWQVLDQPRSSIRVPQAARGEYWQLFLEYHKLDVPWKDDEEAAVKWILNQQPDFFEKHQPFIGYIQFRMEGSLPGGHRIKSSKISVDWVVGGLHGLPRDGDFTAETKRDGPWRFEAK